MAGAVTALAAQHINQSAEQSAYEAVTGATTEFRQVAISPDGRRVAYVEGVHHADSNDSRQSLVYIAEDGATARRITVGSPGADVGAIDFNVAKSSSG